MKKPATKKRIVHTLNPSLTKKEKIIQDNALLLSFVASLTLCENKGDIMDDIKTVLERIGYVVPDDEYDDLEQALRAQLHKNNIRTLHGTDVGSE